MTPTKLDKPNNLFIERARELRKHSTLSEVLLWNRLKNKQFMGLDFDRQKVINNRYIVDFYCPQCNIIIEIDGRSHEHKSEYDLERHEYLTNLGFVVVRVGDLMVKRNMDGVLSILKTAVESITTTPSEFTTTPSGFAVHPFASEGESEGTHVNAHKEIPLAGEGVASRSDDGVVVQTNTHAHKGIPFAGEGVASRSDDGVVVSVNKILSLIILCSLTLFGCSRDPQPPQAQPREFNWTVMGTTAQLIVADDTFDSQKALEITKNAVEEVNTKLSVFNTESDISKLNANTGANTEHILSYHTTRVILKALDFNEISGGAFNPMVSPLVELWGFYRGGEKHDFPPSAEAVSNTLLRCKIEMLVVCKVYIKNGDNDDDSHTNRFSIKPGGRVDFGAIAKGYGVDVAYDALQESGCTNFLINLGGEMRASGKKPWKVAVRNPYKKITAEPLEFIMLSNGMACATSGGYEQFHEKDGVRYCHIIDPRTGYPARGVEQVTVIAPDATTADALATACFVLGVEASRRVLDAFNSSAIFVLESGEIVKIGR